MRETIVSKHILVAVIGTLLTCNLYAQEIVLEGVRLIDGSDSAAREDISIRIVDGVIDTISEKGKTIVPGAGARIVGRGQKLTVVPGLIDAHVHLGSIPGAVFRNEDIESRSVIKKMQLRAYLANGVTTVLDTGISLADLSEIRNWISLGQAAPRVLSLGPPVTAPGGYADVEPESYRFGFAPSSIPEVNDTITSLARHQLNGIKVNIESGFGLDPVLPIPDKSMRLAIGKAAQEHGLDIYVHAISEQEQAIALELQPHAFAHAGGYVSRFPKPLSFLKTDPVSQQHIKKVKQAGVYVISTLGVADANRVVIHPSLLEDSLLKLSVPSAQLVTAGDKNATRAHAFEFLKGSFSKDTPEWLIRLLLFVMPELAYADVESAKSTLANMHAEGVPIVMGSDSGNWELIPFHFHGPSSVREVELLVEAGLSPMQAIQSSTSIAAQMLGMDDRIGLVRVGMVADLIVLDGDVLKDIESLSRPLWIMKGGEMRTPQQWMSKPAG